MMKVLAIISFVLLLVVTVEMAPPRPTLPPFFLGKTFTLGACPDGKTVNSQPWRSAADVCEKCRCISYSPGGKLDVECDVCTYNYEPMSGYSIKINDKSLEFPNCCPENIPPTIEEHYEEIGKK